MRLFALDADRQAAARTAARLGTSLAAYEEREFEDGEFKVRPLESVRGVTAVVWHSLHGRRGHSAADAFCRLLFFVGAVKDAGAAEVVCVAPYLAFSRKDRRTKPRDPLTTRYVAVLLEAVGCDTIVTVDVHNVAAFENAFRCRTLHVETDGLFAAHCAPAARAARRVVALAPDAGGVKRTRAFASRLEAESGREVGLAYLEKTRSEGRVSGGAFAGDVRDAAVFIVDDIVSGGTTLARAARAALDRGASDVHVAATHGLFSSGAAAALADPAIASIAVCDTVADAAKRCPALAPKLTVVETADLLADALRRLHPDRRD